MKSESDRSDQTSDDVSVDHRSVNAACPAVCATSEVDLSSVSAHVCRETTLFCADTDLTSIMSNVSCFWRDPEFQDATLLLSSDPLLLEQTRAALHEALNGATDQCGCVWACMHNPKKRKINPTVDTSTAVNPSQLALQASTSTSNAPPLLKPSATPAASSNILTIPVHRIILSSESAYFKTAISTLIGNRASDAANANCLLSPFHPILLVHEKNICAAEGVLQFLYTKTVDSKFSTASQLMHLLLVCGRNCTDKALYNNTSACYYEHCGISDSLHDLLHIISLYVMIAHRIGFPVPFPSRAWSWMVLET